MSYKYAVSDITFNTNPDEVSDEINALKLTLATIIFSLPSEQGISIMKSIKENEHPYMQKLFNELMQFNPAAGKPVE